MFSIDGPRKNDVGYADIVWHIDDTVAIHVAATSAIAAKGYLLGNNVWITISFFGSIDADNKCTT